MTPNAAAPARTDRELRSASAHPAIPQAPTHRTIPAVVTNSISPPSARAMTSPTRTTSRTPPASARAPARRRVEPTEPITTRRSRGPDRRGLLHGPYPLGVAADGSPQRGLGIEAAGPGPGHHGQQEITERLGLGRDRDGDRDGHRHPRRTARRGRRGTAARRPARAPAEPSGMPSSAEVRPFSAALRTSQLASTASTPSSSRPRENVRVAGDELVHDPARDLVDAERMPRGAPAATRAWNTTWSSRSPSSSRRAARSPSSTASTVS